MKTNKKTINYTDIRVTSGYGMRTVWVMWWHQMMALVSKNKACEDNCVHPIGDKPV